MCCAPVGWHYMNFIRIYSLSASSGQEAALEAALDVLRQIVVSLEGCEDFVICRDQGAAPDYTVLEFWRSGEDHQASASAIPKSTFRAITDTLSEPPKMKDVLRTR
jgi:quinol monooxygenase YgiN